jgi:hypothetical protein
MFCHNSNVRMTCAVFSKLLSRLLMQNFARARETPSNFEIHYAESKKWRTESGYQPFAFVPESRVSCKMCTTPNQRHCRQYASNFEFKYKFFLAQRSVVFLRESKCSVQNVYCNTKPYYSGEIISLLSFFNRKGKFFDFSGVRNTSHLDKLLLTEVRPKCKLKMSY